VPYNYRSLAIMPTTFRLLFCAILDAKEISKVAVACNDTTEYCCQAVQDKFDVEKPEHARRSVWSLSRPQLWFERMLNDRSLDGWWKENFRVSRATFEYICRLVGPALSRQDTAMRAAGPVEKRVSTSLWRLATGDCYRTCGLMMGVSNSTAIQCCHEFVHELNSLQGDFIEFSITRQDSLKKIEGFSQISKIPNVVAAMDGTHIPIKAPLNNHEDYFNRKHFYSYVMQAVVDSHGLYLSVSTGYPSSLHDARVLRLSEILQWTFMVQSFGH